MDKNENSFSFTKRISYDNIKKIIKIRNLDKSIDCMRVIGGEERGGILSCTFKLRFDILLDNYIPLTQQPNKGIKPLKTLTTTHLRHIV